MIVDNTMRLSKTTTRDQILSYIYSCCLLNFFQVHTMFGIHDYFGFLIAGIILNITPGSDTIYILTRSISQGRKAGVYSVLGITSGGLIHTVFASFGLSVILARSAEAFMVVKYLGVIYLVYLGVKMLIQKNNVLNPDINLKAKSMFRVYKEGILTNVLNPKVVLFFLAFMPQFINPDNANGPVPFLLLGATFMTTGMLWCLLVAYASSMVTQKLRANDRIGLYLQKLSGIIFIGLGLRLIADK